MLINVDFSGLEWRVAMYYSQDKVGIQEIVDGVKIHDVNKEYFGFPEKLHAKIFLFRLVFGGTKFGFANDPVMAAVNPRPDFWQGIIDKTYDKYKGLAKWHKKIKQEARETGRLVAPSGREFRFKPILKNGTPEWPDGQIMNYPVQGFGADIVKIARIATYKRLMPHRNRGILLINTVHDSLMADAPDPEVGFTAGIIQKVFDDVPSLVSRCFNINYNIPMGCEIEIGKNWLDMNPYEPKGN